MAVEHPIIHFWRYELKTLSRKQAADLLGICVKTLQRRMKDGTYKYTKIGKGQYAEVQFTYADIGLHEPVEPAPTPELVITEPLPEPEPEPVLADAEIRQQADWEFAGRYLSGHATDSCGNKIDGTNARFLTGSKSLIGIGPEDRAQPQRQDTTSHMVRELVGSGVHAMSVPRPLESDDFNERWQPGNKQRMEQMYRDAGVRQPSAQEQKRVLDRAAINAAFRQGFVR